MINTLPEDLAGWIDISDVEKLNIFLTDMFGSVEEAIEEAIEEVEADIKEEEEILAEQRPQEMERKFEYLENLLDTRRGEVPK